MSEPENFITRWSRRKQADAGGAASDAARSAEQPAENASVIEGSGKSGTAAPGKRGAPVPPAPPFDLATLPPIESITAQTDIRAFLAPGVPAGLTRAALRRAWAADPAIRDFVGLADYDWDFNNPASITGFGSLEMTDELRRQVARIVGHDLPTDESDPAAAGPSAPQAQTGRAETPDKSGASVGSTDGVSVPLTQRNGENPQGEHKTNDDDRCNFEAIPKNYEKHVAAHNHLVAPDDVQAVAKRPHGRALPR